MKSDRLPERFLSKIDFAENGCWIWKACKTSNGYGIVRFKKQTRLAHRAVYFLLISDSIPKGKELDHLCRNRLCVNPEHLEVVTRKENLARSPLTIHNRALQQTHCKRGHPRTKENLSIRHPRGQRIQRICLLCNNIHQKAYQKKKKELRQVTNGQAKQFIEEYSKKAGLE